MHDHQSICINNSRLTCRLERNDDRLLPLFVCCVVCWIESVYRGCDACCLYVWWAMSVCVRLICNAWERETERGRARGRTNENENRIFLGRKEETQSVRACVRVMRETEEESGARKRCLEKGGRALFGKGKCGSVPICDMCMLSWMFWVCLWVM